MRSDQVNPLSSFGYGRPLQIRCSSIQVLADGGLIGHNARFSGLVLKRIFEGANSARNTMRKNKKRYINKQT
jgi:hypothetical protein